MLDASDCIMHTQIFNFLQGPKLLVAPQENIGRNQKGCILGEVIRNNDWIKMLRSAEQI